MKKHQNTLNRVKSILACISLPQSITELPAFDLSKLSISDISGCLLPNNLRLGHLAERVVASAIDKSKNYDLLYENIQLIEHKNTIGELDFILQENETNQIIHLEMAYKFYLYDPSISNKEIERWIGPNRNDSLHKKLEKLKKKQFPLLYSAIAKSVLKKLYINQINQSLCLLVNLYLPYGSEEKISAEYLSAVKGYYLDKATFLALHSDEKKYVLPALKEWGINPKENSDWFTLSEIQTKLDDILADKKSALCWEKKGTSFAEYFVVWW